MPPRFVVFADQELPDLALLLAGVPSDGVGIGVARGADAIARMTAALDDIPVPPGCLEEIGILCHGGPGRLMIGRRPLVTSLLVERAAALRSIGLRLHPSGRLRLIGCSVAAGPQGREFGATMARLLGRRVLGSSSPLGASGACFDVAFEHH